MFAVPNQVIVIRLKDPAAVASNESAVASLINKLAPETGSALLGPIVHKSVMDEIRKSLGSRKPPIEAEVALVDGSVFSGKSLPIVPPKPQSKALAVAVFGGIGLVLCGCFYVMFESNL